MASLFLALGLTGWPGSLYPTAVKNQATHKAFFSAFVVTIYLALVGEKIIVAYYFNWYNTGLPIKIKVYQPADLLPSLSPA